MRPALALPLTDTDAPYHDGEPERSSSWCELLAEHRHDELLGARVEVFRRWPSSTSTVNGDVCPSAL
ncbi:MAG: hypothetical protein ACRDUB_23005, partial [Mycobacterium sp.]